MITSKENGEKWLQKHGYSLDKLGRWVRKYYPTIKYLSTGVWSYEFYQYQDSSLKNVLVRTQNSIIEQGEYQLLIKKKFLEESINEAGEIDEKKHNFLFGLKEEDIVETERELKEDRKVLKNIQLWDDP